MARSRGREHRESSYDDDESFDSYDSEGSESSYDTESDRHLQNQASTEYEDDESFSSDSEPPSDDYSESDSDSMEEDENIKSMDSDVSSSGDEFANEEGSESEEDSENDEDSFGEFDTEDDRFARNKNSFGSEDDSESESEDEEEEDKMGGADDWRRYGYSERAAVESKGNLNSFDQTEDDDGSDSASRSGTDFGDGSTFQDEQYSSAFPSIGRIRTEDSREEIHDPERSFNSKDGFLDKAKGWIKDKLPNKSDKDITTSRSSEPRGSSWFDFSDVMEGKFKWYILGAIAVIFLIAILGGTLRNKGESKPKPHIAASKEPTPTMNFPTPAPTTFAPTLPAGQLLNSFTFYVMIPNGKEDGMTEEELEDELLAALDVLAPQILLNTTETNSNNDAERPPLLRGRRRILKALSVKSLEIDTVTIDCPEIPTIDEFDWCAKATADIIVVTDDGTIDFDYTTAMQDSIQGGDLQSFSTESNTTIVILDADDIVTLAPTMSFSPTISPAPTVSAAPTTSCYDKDPNCEAWANQDPSECLENPEWMTVNCAKACGMCSTDSPTMSPSAAPTATPTVNPSSNATIAPSTNSTLGNSTLAPSNNSTAAPTSSETAIARTSANPTQSPTVAPKSCDNKNTACSEFGVGGECLVTKCALWAGEGECENNPTYMLTNCANSCNACEDVSTEAPTSDPNSNPTPTEAPNTCTDSNSECPSWAAEGECTNNPVWMGANCQLSCDTCQDDSTPPTCVDSDDRCAGWAASGECTKNPVWMSNNCKQSCGACPDEDDTGGNVTNEPDTGGDDGTDIPIIGAPAPSCQDNNDRCAEWAGEGECTSNPTWMLANCPKSCSSCPITPDEMYNTPINQLTEDDEDCIDIREGCHETSPSGDCILSKCAFWASEGECETNPTYMIANCAKSCGKCEREIV